MIYDDIKVVGFSFLISSSVRKYNIHIYKEQKIRTNEISMVEIC